MIYFKQRKERKGRDKKKENNLLKKRGKEKDG